MYPKVLKKGSVLPCQRLPRLSSAQTALTCLIRDYVQPPTFVKQQLHTSESIFLCLYCATSAVRYLEPHIILNLIVNSDFDCKCLYMLFFIQYKI